MDTPPPPTTTITTTINTTLDLDTRIQPDNIPKHLPPPFTNGVLKRLKPRLKPLEHHLSPPVVVTYKECLKNHAATMGGHAVDGCGEFMPSPTSTPTDPTSLKCAACGCHRNFHRREHDGNFPVQHVIEYQPHHRHHPPPPPPQPISIAGARENSITPADSDSPSPPPISSSYYPSAPHMLLALSSGPSETTQYSPIPISGAGKKRFRTKFSQDQKQKMHELAERVGWKMQKKDEDLIIGFCNEIGVDKGVFKVWMHNNKMTLGNKKDSDDHHNNNNNGSSGGGIDFFSNRNNLQQQNQNDSVSSGGGNDNDNNAINGANGSSSSS